MLFSKVDFGKYEELVLPQIIFKDSHWFFNAYEKGTLKNHGFGREAEDLYQKATHIKIPQTGTEKQIAEYHMYPFGGKFAWLDIVPASRPKHKGGSHTFRMEYIDLSFARGIAKNDKLGCSLLVSNVKEILFGSRSYRMTEKRCIEFFSNDECFKL